VTTIQGSETRTRELSEYLGTTLERVSRTWAEYEQRFADVDKSLEEALGKIVEQVQINMNLMHKYVTEFDNKLGHTVGLLSGGIDELGEFSQVMSESVSGLKATIDRAVARA
jgi:hypothetical protein